MSGLDKPDEATGPVATKPITDVEPILRRQEPKSVWGGTYRGVGFEINNWRTNDPYMEALHPGGNWTFYIYLQLAKLPKEKADRLWLKGKTSKFFSTRKMYNYYDCDLLADIDFHSEITWYSKEYNLHDERVVKVGCDYMHYGDEHQYYTKEYILNDVKRAIDSLEKMLPELLVGS